MWTCHVSIVMRIETLQAFKVEENKTVQKGVYKFPLHRSFGPVFFRALKPSCCCLQEA
jgi:hypothetical protein